MSAAATLVVANRLAELCRANQPALDELYAENVVSIESMPNEGETSAEKHGLAALRAKHEWWYSMFEVNSGGVEGPFPHGEDRFALIFELDATERATGKRLQMKDIGIYTVSDGKIVREEFFYGCD